MEKDLTRSIDLFVQVISERKAEDLVVLDVRGLTSYADFFILCSGRSSRQVIAIAEHVRDTLKIQGVRPLSIEGLAEGHWALMDYGHVIVHVFYEPIRRFYDLEGLWMDAKRLDFSDRGRPS